MAEGRMLKKVICTSRKLAALKTDTARLLYTWLLPNLDIEGRFSGDPDVIKGAVVPRVKSITTEIIQECLFDMQNCKLIKLYRVDGDVFLDLVGFKDHQILRADREKTSRIPAPEKRTILTPAELPQPPESKQELLPELGGTPGVLRDNSGRTPAQDKIREDKIIKANNPITQTDTPLENTDIKKTPVFKKIKDLMLKFPDIRYQTQITEFVKANWFKNDQAIEHCLNQLLISENKITNPKGYMEKILSVENGNFNERESISTHLEHKKDIKIPTEIGNILKSMTH